MRNSKFMKKAVALFLTLSLGASVGPAVTKSRRKWRCCKPVNTKKCYNFRK